MDNNALNAANINNSPLSATPLPRDSDFSFADLVKLLSHAMLVIRSRWYWGLLGALAVGGSSGYFLFKQRLEFTAQTALVAQSSLDKVIGTQGDGGGDQARENNLRNHLSMMNSRKFHARLLGAFTPAERAAIAEPYLKPGEVADDDFFQGLFARKISIERERGREYYTISVSHYEPRIAMMVADRVASEYLNYVQQEFKDANLRGYQILEKQAETIRNDVANVESARLDYRKQHGIISRSDNQSILNDRLKRLDASLTETRIKRVGLETLSRQATADRARSQYPWDNAYLAGFANNETLRQELDRQFAQRGVLASRYGPNHPKLRDVDSQITGIQSAIQRNFDVAVRDLAAQLDVVVKTEALLKKEFDDAFESSIEIEKLASNYEILSAGVDSKKITLNELERKIGEASISSKLPADFLQVVDPAYIVKPRIPKQVLYGALVGCLAFAAFLITPLLISALDERVSATADVEDLLGLPLVGAVPTLKLRREDRAHVVRDSVDVVTTETFLGMAGHLELNSGQRYPKVILVTSTLPGEGKSLIASNLASTYQRLEKRTLLIDLDLRRPVQNRLHGVVSPGGFLTWAREGFPLDNILNGEPSLNIQKLPDGVELIVAGGSEPQPGRLIIAKGMEAFIDRLKESYDVIILDTPPAGVFQDALVLARHANDALLVVREGMAPVVQVRNVIDNFARANLSFRGVILNGFSPRNANKELAYAYKAATKGYSYGERPGKKVRPVPVPNPVAARG